jgi:transcription-repair coupling factor (superfamily II helicase)
MKIQDINCLYGASPQAGALLKILENKSVNRVFLQGLLASSVPMLFASVASRLKQTFLFVLPDADEGGYFYHDLVQLMGQKTVFYFPSSYRRAVKYGQRDAANEILRTEVLSKIDFGKCLYIVTSPDALSELVVSKSSLDNRLLKLKTGQNIDITDVEKTLREFGFEEVDYVYEPGQFAVRGSILDVFSFSCEYPFRIDFFGDEIDTIRTFEVQDQLSQDKRIEIEIVPELAAMKENKVPFLDFLPDDTVLVMKDFAYVRDSIDKIYREGFSRQAMTEQLEGVTEVEKAEILLNLQKERNLCTGSQFSEETARFKWVEFGPQPNSAILAYDKRLSSNSTSLLSLCSIRILIYSSILWKTISSRAISSIFSLIVRNSNNGFGTSLMRWGLIVSVPAMTASVQASSLPLLTRRSMRVLLIMT